MKHIKIARITEPGTNSETDLAKKKTKNWSEHGKEGKSLEKT